METSSGLFSIENSKEFAENESRPNLFIAGFAKCGTTELCNYLAQHPAVYLPFEKEPNTFYNLTTYPRYFSGDKKGIEKHVIIQREDYLRMYRPGKNHAYRIDGTVSYTFHNDFPQLLRQFSPNAKALLIIRDQSQRLVSMYFHSYVVHRQDDFSKWIHDYFLPDINSYLYYDKIVSFSESFREDLRIVETRNLNHPEIHKLLFEFLNLDQITISPNRKNANLLSPSDGRLYRLFIQCLASVKLAMQKLSHIMKLELQFLRFSYLVGDIMRKLIKQTKPHSDYSDMVKMIPPEILMTLSGDYENTISYAKRRNLLISI
jgi:hypothetical protein